MKTIGERVRDLRKAKGFTRQGDLAKLVGVDQSVISDIERGAGFKADILMALCEHLGTSAEYLMRGQESAASGEAEILGLFRKLSDEGRAALQAAARGLLTSFPRLEKVSSHPPKVGVTPANQRVRTDTVIPKDKNLELSVEGTYKTRGTPSEQDDSNPEPRSPERGKHVKGAAPARRAR